MKSVAKGLSAVFATLFLTTAYAEPSIAGVIVARLGSGSSLCFLGLLLAMIAVHVLFIRQNFWAGEIACLVAVLTLIIFVEVALAHIGSVFILYIVGGIAVVAAIVVYYPFFWQCCFADLSNSDKKMVMVAIRVYYVCIGLVPFIVYFHL